jgi:hypothetical protein
MVGYYGNHGNHTNQGYPSTMTISSLPDETAILNCPVQEMCEGELMLFC